MFYPVLMYPIHSFSRKDTIVLLACSSVLIGGFYYITKPNIQMRVNNDLTEKNHATIMIRKQNYLEIENVKNININCLSSYSITNESIPINMTENKWTPIAYVDLGTKTIQDFKMDCKKCNVYSEISYVADNFLRNEYSDKKTLNWSLNFKDNLE